MLKRILKFKAVLVLFLVASLLSLNAFAAEERRQEGRQPQGRKVAAQRAVGLRPGGHRVYKHYNRDGKWYKRGLFGIDMVVATLAIGTLVQAPPPQSTVVMTQVGPYYYDGSTYYAQSPYGGYVVVQAPVAVIPQH